MYEAYKEHTTVFTLKLPNVLIYHIFFKQADLKFVFLPVKDTVEKI